MVFTCRFSAVEEPIKLGVPFRSLGEQIEQGMSRADLYRDMPRGPKRAGWKKEFLEALSEAAKDIGRYPKRRSSARFAVIVKRGACRRSPLLPKSKKRKQRAVADTNVVVAGISGFRDQYIGGRVPSGICFAGQMRDRLCGCKRRILFAEGKDSLEEPARPIQSDGHADSTDSRAN